MFTKEKVKDLHYSVSGKIAADDILFHLKDRLSEKKNSSVFRRKILCPLPSLRCVQWREQDGFVPYRDE